MKKIVFVVQALWMGGVETALVTLINNLDYDQYDVTCVILSNELLLLERIDKRCKTVVCDRLSADYKYKRLYGLCEEPSNPSKIHKCFMWFKPFFKAIEQLLFSRFVRNKIKDRFDAAIIYDIRAAEATCRGIRADKYLMYYHHGAMGHVYHDEIGYKKSDKIIVVSNSLREKMQIANPKYSNKMITIHNLVNTDYIIEKSKEAVQLSDKFNIVTCGRLSYEKGIDVAIKTCSELVKKGWEDFHWFILGGGREEEKLKQMIQELEVSEYLTMVGEVNNPYPYISKADLFAQTSRKEGYSITLLEALTLKKVIVATNTDGTAEILNNGQCGMIVDCDSDAIAEAIFELIQDEKMYEHYRKNVSEVDINKDNSTELEKLYELIGE